MMLATSCACSTVVVVEEGDAVLVTVVVVVDVVAVATVAVVATVVVEGTAVDA